MGKTVRDRLDQLDGGWYTIPAGLENELSVEMSSSHRVLVAGKDTLYLYTDKVAYRAHAVTKSTQRRRGKQWMVTVYDRRGV